MSVKTGVEVEHSSARISGSLAVVAGVIAVLGSGLGSILALLFGLLGLVGLVVGIFGLTSRSAVVASCGVMFVGVITSGLIGNTPSLVLASTLGTILAMDLGQNAVSIGRQMTDSTYTRRGEFAHAAASTVVGVVVTGLGYGVYRVAAGGRPVSALVVTLFAVVLLAWAIRS